MVPYFKSLTDMQIPQTAFTVSQRITSKLQKVFASNPYLPCLLLHGDPYHPFSFPVLSVSKHSCHSQPIDIMTLYFPSKIKKKKVNCTSLSIKKI